jgi:hypothetical protein
MKKLIQETIVEMIKENKLQFEVDIKDNYGGKYAVINVYHRPDFYSTGRLIQYKEEYVNL